MLITVSTEAKLGWIFQMSIIVKVSLYVYKILMSLLTTTSNEVKSWNLAMYSRINCITWWNKFKMHLSLILLTLSVNFKDIPHTCLYYMLIYIVFYREKLMFMFHKLVGLMMSLIISFLYLNCTSMMYDFIWPIPIVNIVKNIFCINQHHAIKKHTTPAIFCAQLRREDNGWTPPSWRWPYVEPSGQSQGEGWCPAGDIWPPWHSHEYTSQTSTVGQHLL